MRIFKNKEFNRWAAKQGLLDQQLVQAIQQMNHGLVDVDLGGGLYKKRIALNGKGKSGGLRTLIAYTINDKAFFIYGFTKSSQANITEKELKALKLYAAVLVNYTNQELDEAASKNLLYEVINDE